MNQEVQRRQRFVESLVLVLIGYSLVTHFLELELGPAAEEEPFFVWSEHIVAGLFTVEYGLRWIASRSWSYPLRLMAIVDLLAILPFYLGFLIDLRSLRLIRLVRVARLFKLTRYTTALRTIQGAFTRVRYEFGVLAFAVFLLLWISSVTIYEFEGPAQPAVFGRLSDAAWYTLVTLTTVGYGDKVPVTLGGKLTAAFTMIAGLGLFGTFVSLIGSSFLEELRNTRLAREPAAQLKEADS